MQAARSAPRGAFLSAFREAVAESAASSGGSGSTGADVPQPIAPAQRRTAHGEAAAPRETLFRGPLYKLCELCGSAQQSLGVNVEWTGS